MKKKINVLLVSVSFTPKSGVGIIEHGVLIYKGLKKYAKNIDAKAYSLSNKRLFDRINKTSRAAAYIFITILGFESPYKKFIATIKNNKRLKAMPLILMRV